MGQSLSPHYANSLIHTFKSKLTKNKITLGNQWHIIYSEKLINMKGNFSPTNMQAHSFEWSENITRTSCTDKIQKEQDLHTQGKLGVCFTSHLFITRIIFIFS